MLHWISGGRWDGRDWPDAGGEIDIPEQEARDLIAGNMAVAAAPLPARSMTEGEPEPPAEPLPAPPPPEDTQVSAVTQVSPLAQAALTGAGAAAQPAEPAEMPRPQDPKQAWIDWAVASGAGAEQAAAMTKADLMSRYGGRL
jgi:hypothetical protein